MSDELFASEFVSVPRHGECMATSVLKNAGYTEVPTTLEQADKLYQIEKISVWCAGRVFVKDGRTYMFSHWNESKDARGDRREADAVIIRDVTDIVQTYREKASA